MPVKLSRGPRVGFDLSRVGGGLSRGPNRKKTMAGAPWTAGVWPAPGATLDLDFANDRGFVRGVGQGRSMDAVTFTRASSGAYVGSDGLLKAAGNNAPRFDWASTARIATRNLLNYTQTFSSSLSASYWSNTNLNITLDLSTDPVGSNAANLIVPNTTNGMHIFVGPQVGSGGSCMHSIFVKAAGYSKVGLQENYGQVSWASFDLTGVGSVISSGGNGSGSTITALSGGWYRIMMPATQNLSAKFAFWVLSPSYSSGVFTATNWAGDGVSGVYACGAQLEAGSSVTPYEAVSSATTNTPLVATPTCNGLLPEEARTNSLLWCRDATNAAWAKTNVTTALDQVGIDGVANAATSLTATADNATCIQQLTAASAAKASSAFLKRLTGTGNVQVTLDGSTWSTVDLSNGIYNRIALTGTLANPAIGVRLATSGDAVVMDYAQIEAGAYVTSPILTTSATATRAQDVASMIQQNFSSWYKNGLGTMYSETMLTQVGCVSYSITALDNANFTAVYRDTATTYRGQVKGSGAGSFPYSSSQYGSTKTAMRIQNGSFGVSVDKVAITSNLSGLSPNMVCLFIGGYYNNTAQLNTCIKRLTYFPFILSDVALQNITGGAT